VGLGDIGHKTKIKKDNIYFTFRHKDEIRSTLLPVGEIKYYQLNFFKNSEVPRERVIGNRIYKHFRIALNGGYGYRTNKMSSTIPSDFSEFKIAKSKCSVPTKVSPFFWAIDKALPNAFCADKDNPTLVSVGLNIFVPGMIKPEATSSTKPNSVKISSAIEPLARKNPRIIVAVSTTPIPSLDAASWAYTKLCFASSVKRSNWLSIFPPSSEFAGGLHNCLRNYISFSLFFLSPKNYKFSGPKEKARKLFGPLVPLPESGQLHRSHCLFGSLRPLSFLPLFQGLVKFALQLLRLLPLLRQQLSPHC
jgi:hypothetical protein